MLWGSSRPKKWMRISKNSGIYTLKIRLHSCLIGHADAVLSIAFSPDNQTLASASQDKTIGLWDVSTGQELWQMRLRNWQAFVYRLPRLIGLRFKHDNWVNSLAFHPSGQTLATGSFDHTVRLWETATGRQLGRWTGHTKSVTSVAFNAAGTLLASASVDRTIRVWALG